MGAEPEGAPIEEQGLGWTSAYATGIAGDAITSGLEVTWTSTPTKWSNDFFEHLFKYEWELTKSPGGAHQWKPKGNAGAGHGTGRSRPLKASRTGDADHRSLFAARSGLRKDLETLLRESGKSFADAFARAWFKLTHRDMGPRARYLGPEVPKEELLWQDPIPAVNHALVDDQDVASLKEKILASGLTVSQLVSTAWASASTYRGSDKRGGANGARIRLAPQKDWKVNQPEQLAESAEGTRKDSERLQRARSLAARKSRSPT